MTSPTENHSTELVGELVGALCSVFGRVHRGSTVEFLCSSVSYYFFVESASCFISVFNFDLHDRCFDQLMGK